MKLVDLIFIAFVMLFGEEDKDYLLRRQSDDEWRAIGWIRRN